MQACKQRAGLQICVVWNSLDSSQRRVPGLCNERPRRGNGLWVGRIVRGWTWQIAGGRKSGEAVRYRLPAVPCNL